MDTVFKNYDAFYNMVLSTTMLSNAHTSEFESDAKKIIDFIGKAYLLNDDLIENYKDIILDTLAPLGLTTDQQAIYSSRQYGDEYSAEDVLFDIKGDVLSKLQSLSDADNAEINPSWFDYSHYKTYQREVRFAKILTTSASGNLIATRQVAIMLSLGIGCAVNLEEAANRLLQCVFWGDIPSMYFLAHVFAIASDKEKSKLFYELATLSERYLKGGYTVLPEKTKTEFSEDARTYFVYIASIKQDIVYAYNKFSIDFSFIEAITSESLDFYQIMGFIDNYEKKEWKNITNSSQKPTTKLGFK